MMAVRIVALIMISYAAVWVALEVVSLALGTTQFGWSPGIRGSVQAWAWRLMWIGIAISIVHTGFALFIGLMGRLGLSDDGNP